MICSVGLVSGEEQSESAICIHISTLIYTLFPYRPSQSTEQSSLCHAAGPYWLSVSYISLCMRQPQSPSLSLAFKPAVITSLFSTSATLFLFVDRFISALFFFFF